MFKDLRHAARMLLQAKGWTAIVVASLALGIGANTALFSAVNGMLLRKVPVREPDSLVRLNWMAVRNDMTTSSSDYGFSAKDASGQDVRSTFSYPMFRQFAADNRTMTDLFACAPYGRVNVVVNGQAETASAFIASGNYYRMLGVSALRGRTILPEDDQPAAPPVAMISERYWRSRFGSSPDVVGTVVQINNVPLTIVGVLPPEFTGVQQPVSTGPEVSVPLALDGQLSVNAAEAKRLNDPTYWWLQVMGRLTPGATVEQVKANLETVFQHTARAGLDSYLAGLPEAERSNSRNRERKEVPQLRVSSGSRGVYDPNTTEVRAVTILTGVVALVLLIVCANVANLLLSRATAREKEISVRLSMGATRLRLIRQLLTESLLLASIGGGLGILVGYWGKRLLPGPAGLATPLDWRVLSFVLAVTGLTGLIFGIAPALRATGINVSTTLKESSRSVARSQSFLSKALLVVQVAISLVLLIGAGLFLGTLQNLRQVDVGFDARNLVLFRVNPQLNRYDEKRITLLYQQLTDRLRTISGVRAVTISQPALLSGSVNGTSIFVQGRVYPPGTRDSINRVVVAPNFFATMGIPVLLGRGFTDRDNETAPKVVIINEAAARQYFPDQNPIGQRFGSSPETSGQQEIVGVLRDAKYNSVREAAPATMYVPHLQARMFGPRLRRAHCRRSTRRCHRDSRSRPPGGPQSAADERRDADGVDRAAVCPGESVRAGVCVVRRACAGAGVDRHLRLDVVQRGAPHQRNRHSHGPWRTARRTCSAQIMRESMMLVIAGVAMGWRWPMAAGRLIASLLFGLSPTDVLTMLLAMALMVIVSALAGYLPARRASRVDPMVALRYE